MTRPLVCWLCILIHLFWALNGAQGAVLCLKADGGVRVENTAGRDHCHPAAACSSSPGDEMAAIDHCDECRDIPLSAAVSLPHDASFPHPPCRSGSAGLLPDSLAESRMIRFCSSGLLLPDPTHDFLRTVLLLI